MYVQVLTPAGRGLNESIAPGPGAQNNSKSRNCYLHIVMECNREGKWLSYKIPACY